MKPSQYRQGAPEIAIRVAVTSTSLGLLIIAATDKGVCAIEFGDSEHELLSNLRERFPMAKLDHSPDFQDWVTAIVAHVDAADERLAIPLDIQGTAFQRRVWETLRQVPAGTTTTYSEVAKKIGQPTAARAVAGACAANQLAVLIPCHRVLRSDGELGGYRWGIHRKEALLAKESEQ